MLHINRPYPPTLPCYPFEQRNMIRLLYRSSYNLPIYISVRSHPPTSPLMSDWRAPSWSSAAPLSGSADRSVRAALGCVWKWTARRRRRRRRSLQIKNDFSLVKHTAVISGPARLRAQPQIKWLHHGGGSWGLLIRWREHLSLFIHSVDQISPHE